MIRIASLADIPEQQLNRLIRRIGLLLLLSVAAFGLFYVVDRNPAAGPSLVERQITRLEEAIRAEPANLVLRLQVARLYAAEEQWDNALAQYDEVLSADATNANATFGKAMTLYLQGTNLDAAASLFEDIIERARAGEFAAVDPQLQSAYYSRGDIALRQDDPSGAVEWLAVAVTLNPIDADALASLGVAYLRAGRPADAIEPLRKAILFVPTGWAEPYAALRDAYAALDQAAASTWAAAMVDLAEKRPTEALAKLEPLSGDGASVDVYVGLGLIHEYLHEAGPAAAWYGKAIALEPDNSTATDGLARLSAGSGGSPGDAEVAP